MNARVLPPGIPERSFDEALSRVAAEIGSEWVFTSTEDLHPYLDPYAPGDGAEFAASAAVAPASAEQVQAIVRIANEARLPLWPVSTGRNLGYGGAAPRMRGTVVLDLKRMNRVIEVNESLGYALVEPGVSFFDLHRHLKERGLKLWISTPAPGWGSVIGNTLERGYGYTPYGDHAAMQCGMEVVLGNGELVRTGMGAIEGSPAWQVVKAGFGPSHDGLFLQSNFGVVTKMGVWLMPQPESYRALQMRFRHEDDLGQIVERLRPLRLDNTIENSASIAGAVRQIAAVSTREQWYDGDGPMPPEAIRRALGELGLGHWHVRCALYSESRINQIKAEKIRRTLGAIEGCEIEEREYDIAAGEEVVGPDRIPAGIPGLAAMQVVNWRGGNGGHMSFSPISPLTAEHAVRQYRLAKASVEAHGLDYYGGFAVSPRHLNHIIILIYDRDNPAMVRATRDSFLDMMAKATAAGYGEYRAHLAFMDEVAAQFRFNDGALGRLNGTLKKALDPNGILAPGKQGIWPDWAGQEVRGG